MSRRFLHPLRTRLSSAHLRLQRIHFRDGLVRSARCRRRLCSRRSLQRLCLRRRSLRFRCSHLRLRLLVSIGPRLCTRLRCCLKLRHARLRRLQRRRRPSLVRATTRRPIVCRTCGCRVSSRIHPWADLLLQLIVLFLELVVLLLPVLSRLAQLGSGCVSCCQLCFELGNRTAVAICGASGFLCGLSRWCCSRHPRLLCLYLSTQCRDFYARGGRLLHCLRLLFHDRLHGRFQLGDARICGLQSCRHIAIHLRTGR